VKYLDWCRQGSKLSCRKWTGNFKNVPKATFRNGRKKGQEQRNSWESESGGGGGVDDTEYSSVVKTIALPVNYKMPQVAQCQKFIWR
jgi:hypothetical protein